MELLFLVFLVVPALGHSEPTEISDPYSDEGCGTTRTCFRKPSDCTGTSGNETCEMFISWWPTDDGKGTNFALFGAAKGYIAVGISRSTGMPDTDVYSCTSELGVKRSYNQAKGHENIPKPLIGVTGQSVLYEDNFIKCQFVRQQSLEDGDDTFFDISGKYTYYSLMAIGDTLDDGSITNHRVREGSDRKVSFSEAGEVKNDYTKLRLRKAHGIMMIIAWIGLAAPGITVARYFRPFWSNRNLCGGKVWFAIHRFSLVTTFVLTCAAFVTIFVAEKKFLMPKSGAAKFLHNIFGCIVMALSIVNVIMAIFRPHPGEPKRKYYNWSHRTAGMTALVLSAVTNLIALNNNDPFLPNLSVTTFWVVLGFVVYHIVTWLLYELLPKVRDSRKVPEIDDIPMSEGKNTGRDGEVDEDPFYKRLINYLYTVVVIAVTVWVSAMLAITKK